MAMLHKADFFQEQINQCSRLAAQASNKNDREFWLQMTQRWEGLLRPSDATAPECKRRCKSDPGRRMRSDPPDTLGVSRWEAPDADRGRGRGDPSAAPARNEHPRDCENDWDIAQRGSALSAHTGSAALQKAGAEAIKTRSI